MSWMNESPSKAEMDAFVSDNKCPVCGGLGKRRYQPTPKLQPNLPATHHCTNCDALFDAETADTPATFRYRDSKGELHD